MAIRAPAAHPESEEILFENTRVSLCLLINRPARTLRIFDFRAGADPTKRGYVTSIAQREGVERIFTVVERDEVGVWSRLGFQREGTIPGFFKRSDAYVLGERVPAALGSNESFRSGEHTIDHEALAERTYQQARKLAKDFAPRGSRLVRLQPASESVVRKATASAARSGRALTRFQPFGRDVVRDDYQFTARGGFSLIASVERQPCFDNAFIELLTAPRTERDMMLTHAAVSLLCDRLMKEGTVACFTLSPTDNVGLAAAWVGNGFRRTGLLPDHLVISGQRRGAFLFTRKLTVPADE
jgi:hypothetical protein